MGELDPAQAWLELVFITGLVGGGAAWLAGRAIARTWRPLWQVIGYMVALGAAVRFLHFALAAAPFSLAAYGIDTIFVVLVGCLAFRLTRTTQMVRQYPWLYQRTGPLTWREREQSILPQSWAEL